MANSYQRIPVDEPRESTSSPRPSSADEDTHRPLRAAVQAEFNRAPPAVWKRVLLVVAIVVMGWLAIRLGTLRGEQPKVIYASRYNDEFKYRPAASPVITEHLKDGRIRLRGASPAGVGIREGDLPMTPEKKAREEKKRVQNAREAAKEKLKATKKQYKNTKKRGKKGKKET